VVLILGIILVCGSVSGADESLIYLRFSDTASLDPGQTTTQYSGEVVANLFEGLVRYKRGSQSIVPWLATRWEMLSGGRLWVFHLRRDVLFHDGSPLTAGWVVYSFHSRMKGGDETYPKWRLFFPTMTGVHARNRYTVEIVFSRPFAPLLTALTDPVAYIVPTGAYEARPFKPIGTGPFTFKAWEKEKHIILTRNEKYWEKPVAIAQVTFKIVRNPVWRINQIRTGQAQVLEIRSATAHAEFLGSREISVISNPPNGVFYLAFNTRRHPFDRREVRQAFAHMIDRKVLVRQVFQQFAIPATTPLPPHIPGFNREIPIHTYDLDRARALLRQAGLEKGFSCRILFLAGDLGEQKIVDSFVRNARRLGITIEKTPSRFPELLRILNASEHDMVIRGWIAGPDPDIFLVSNFTLEPGHTNWSGYTTPRLTDLLIRARETMNPEPRMAMYRSAQEIIFRDVPWVPLYHLKYLIVHDRDLADLYLDSNGYIVFSDVHRTDR